MLRILLGRARTGKSARVLEEIRTLGDSSQQILLVPEHASHVAEVDVCRACGVTASRHAEVLTFKLLASRVLTLTGGAAEVTLDNGGKLLLLQRVLVSLAPSLRVYRRPSQRAAFLESLLALIEELQAYAVAPEVLAVVACPVTVCTAPAEATLEACQYASLPRYTDRESSVPCIITRHLLKSVFGSSFTCICPPDVLI